MWKDFFYYSKIQRLVTILIIMIMLLCIIIMIFLFNKKDSMNEYSTSNAIDSFLLQVKEKEKKHYDYKKRFQIRIISKLSFFDPNMIDSISMIQLGLPYYVAHNILKYRKAKGVFRSKEQFKRIYGLRTELYNRLEKYIVISPDFLVAHKMNLDTLKHKRDSLFFKYPIGTVIDLNEADTNILKKIPGIGIGMSKLIISYRKILGGFYSVDQLDDVDYFDKSLKKWFQIKAVNIVKIDINHASLEKLRIHPYLNFYQAKAIIEYRRKRGKIKNLSQLSLLEEFTEKDLNRLSYYLSFN